MLAVTAVGVVAAASGTSAVHRHQSEAGQAARQAFHDQMRKLWEDHITWTRLYIVSAATLPDNLPDTGPTADRLFQNQADIGAAVGSFYGQAAGDQLTALLKEHIALAAQAIAAAKAGDNAGLQSALDDWYANADAIARFLSNANPRAWPFAEMDAHMRDHLPLAWDQLQRLGHVLAELVQHAAAAGTGRRRRVNDALARQMLRQRPARRLAPLERRNSDLRACCCGCGQMRCGFGL